MRQNTGSTTVGIDRTDHARFTALAKAAGLYHTALFCRMLNLWEATPDVERDEKLLTHKKAALAAKEQDE